MNLPEVGLVDLSQILGQSEVTPEQAQQNRARGKGPRRPRPGAPGILPIGKTTWWEGVRAGKYPPPVKLGRRTFWRAADIRRLVESL